MGSNYGNYSRLVVMQVDLNIKVGFILYGREV